jgi:hypothetical protein
MGNQIKKRESPGCELLPISLLNEQKRFLDELGEHHRTMETLRSNPPIPAWLPPCIFWNPVPDYNGGQRMSPMAISIIVSSPSVACRGCSIMCISLTGCSIATQLLTMRVLCPLVVSKWNSLTSMCW